MLGPRLRVRDPAGDSGSIDYFEESIRQSERVNGSQHHD